MRRRELLVAGAIIPSTMRMQSAIATAVEVRPRQFRKLCGGFTFTEGPVCSTDGDLYFSDVGQERIYRWSNGSLRVVRNSSNLANGLAFDRSGRMIVCERGRVTRTEQDGRITILAEAFDGKGLHWPNDVVVRSDGSIFFTDLKQKTEWANPAKTGFNAVYLLSPGGTLVLFATDCETPNGIALSPAEDRLYVVDTDRRNVRTYRVDGAGARKGRVFAETSAAGAPDGIKTDADGNVWVCEQEGVVVFSPAGERLLTTKIPEQPSNCAFSRSGSSLFVTATTSVYEVVLAERA